MARIRDHRAAAAGDRDLAEYELPDKPVVGFSPPQPAFMAKTTKGKAVETEIKPDWPAIARRFVATLKDSPKFDQFLAKQESANPELFAEVRRLLD